MNQIKQGLIQINMAVILLGGTTLFAKLVSLPAATIIMFRALFGLIALICVIKLFKQTFKLSAKSEYVFMGISGVLMGVHWVSFFHAIQVSSVAIGIVAMYTFPVITAFLEPVIERQRIRTSDLLCALAVFAGIVIMIPEFNLSNTTMLGVLWGVFSATLLSFRNIIVRKQLKKVAGTVTMAYQLLITLLILLPFAPKDFDYTLDNRLPLLVALGVIFTAIPHTLFVASLKNLRATTASLISCMQPFYSTFLAFIFLSDVPDYKVVIGGIIVVGASVYESMRSIRGAKA